MKRLVAALTAVLLLSACGNSQEERERDFIAAIESGNEYGDYAMDASYRQSTFLLLAYTFCEDDEGGAPSANMEVTNLLADLGYPQVGHADVFGAAAREYLC